MSTERLNKELSSHLSPVAYLTLQNQGQRQIIEIQKIATIGRDHTGQILIEDPFVSSRHARIEYKEDQGFVLRDLRSRNGTYLNGARVIEARLSDHDRIQVGLTQIQFSLFRDNKAYHLKTKSQNEAWNESLTRLPSIAQSDFTVLLTGPSGSGKDVLAHQIHEYSFRQHAPFISVNCSALTESLVESELFGHTKGSFTGATHLRKGAFEVARGGTLFLDEIGDLPISLQPKLLRALENKEIKAVGSDQIIHTDVRVIAATHQNLREKVRQGLFREDLFFRLNIVRLMVPALRERMEDFDNFFYHFAKEQRVRFSHKAIEVLKTHPWPGNIRELKNLISRAAALFKGKMIECFHIPTLLDTPLENSYGQNTLESELSLVKRIEREMIRERLLANNGNQRRTASELGIPKSTLHDRIKSYNINIGELLGRDGTH